MDIINKSIILPHEEMFVPEEYNLEAMEHLFYDEVNRRTVWHNLPYWIAQFTQEQRSIIFNSLDLARILHNWQFREESAIYKPWDEVLFEGKLPYLIHPIETAYEALMHNEWYIATSWLLLHDTREDTKARHCNRQILRRAFIDQEIELLTKILSNQRYWEKLPEEQVEENLKKSPLAINCKGYDVKRNELAFWRMVLTKPERVQKNITKHRHWIIELLKEFNFELYKEVDEVNRKLQERLDATWWRG